MHIYIYSRISFKTNCICNISTYAKYVFRNKIRNVVMCSLVGVVIDDVLRAVFITPTLLRVVRVFRIGRVLRRGK